MTIRHVLWTIAAAALPLLCQGQPYWFNDGSNEGWTCKVRRWYDNVTVSSGAASWDDLVNYPSDSNTYGDDIGSIQELLTVDQYETASADDWIVVEFYSPDLTKSTLWQAARTFSAQLLRGFGSATGYEPYPDIYGSIWVAINDLDGLETTYLTMDPIELPDPTWTRLEYDLEGALSAEGIVNYEVAQVLIVFWVEGGGDLSFLTGDDPLSFYVDNVLPRIVNREILSISREWDVDVPPMWK